MCTKKSNAPKTSHATPDTRHIPTISVQGYASSSFTQSAADYARTIQTRIIIILIDGPRLTDLMIKYRVGVQVSQSFDVVEVDENFFE